MGVTVITGHRLEALFDALCEQLASSPADPMATETILVPGQGIARWLELRLAERLGIAAGVETPFLGAWLHQLTEPSGPDGDPFAREVLVWRLWRLLGERSKATADKDRFGAASDYIENDHDGRKRLQLCTRLSACFDDYQLYRDDLLDAFARGDDHKALSEHAPWQARLWRALLADAGLELPDQKKDRSRRGDDATPLLFAELAEPPPPPSCEQAHRIASLRARLDDQAWCRQHLPPRLWVFGTTTMPPAFLDVLHRIGHRIDVHLFVPQPTPHFVGDLRERSKRSGDNALLARFGAESRDFQGMLVDLEERSDHDVPVEQHPLDTFVDDDRVPDTLLACLQQDLVQAFDRGERDAAPFVLRADDDSLRIHDCHSPQRELEVVRDQICAAFDADPTLQPRDVMVLVPDVDRYAPYAHAVFGPLQHRLPFHLADRHPARELPICRALLQVLELARTRLTLAEVLHLLETPAIQRRFGLFPSDVPVVRHLCREAGIRWGLDGDSRREHFELPAFDDNAWRPGLERLLLGTLTGPLDELVCGRAPVGDTTEARAELLARFVAFTRVLFAQVAALRQPHALQDWADRVDQAVAELFEAGDPDEEEAVRHLRRATVALRGQARTAAHVERLQPAVMHAWLEGALAHGASHSRLPGQSDRGFLGGAITFAAMLPMRAVPVRALFVCGLDDESFPRRDNPSPFDLIAARARPGDRSRRLDDRQLFLDLMLAARDRLHLTFVGHSAKDNAEGAPSVVLSELLEHVERTCTTEGRRSATELLVVGHPLQPWSPRYRGGGDARLFTYARQPAIGDDDAGPAPWCPPDEAVLEVPEDAREHVALDDLLQFWWHPCRFFLQRGLRVRVRQDEEQEDAAEPFEIDGLTRYHLQDEAVRRAQRGDDEHGDPLAWTRQHGVLPVGAQGDVAFHALRADTQRLLHEARQYAHTVARRVDVQLGRADAPGARLTGQMHGFGPDGRTYMRVSKLKAKDRMRAWIEHLVLCLQAAQQPDAEPAWPNRTRVLSGDAEHEFLPVPGDQAVTLLARLVQLFRTGLTRPLPFFERSSFVVGSGGKKDPESLLRRARREYELGDRSEPFRYDLGDEAVALCMRDRDPIDAGVDGEFYRLASELWQPALSFLKEVT
ncbi:MAG: exodeoxyribonuclease V subunit gamma [Planctomycetota bacterium]